MKAASGWRPGGFPRGSKGSDGCTSCWPIWSRIPATSSIGIETDRGLWVHALAAAGYEVYAINPLAAARYRERHNVGGAKSDAGDAKVLADLVRTDRHNHRPIAADSPDAEAVKVLARGHQNLIWARNRHTNQLRNALREYYPAALEAFSDLADRDALAVLGRAPTPALGAALSLSQLRSTLQRAGRQRNLDRRARRDPSGPARSSIWPHQRRSPWPSPPPPRRRSGSSPSSTVRSPSSRPPSPTILSSTRTPTSTSPCQDSVMYSAPGCSASSGTPPIDTPAPSLARTTPARHHSPSLRARNGPSSPDHVRNRRLYDAIDQWAFCSLSASPGCRAYYDQRPGRRGPSPPSAASPRQPPRRHPPRLSTTRTHYDEHTAWAHRYRSDTDVAA